MAKLGNSVLYNFYFNASAETISKARSLRKEMTPAERKLWNCLKHRQFHGLKFRRQHPIEIFIVDFYCHEKKLVIEVDGPVHKVKTHKEYDISRTAELEKFELTVLRFTNDEIMDQISEVLVKIYTSILSIPHPLSPPLHDGEEDGG